MAIGILIIFAIILVKFKPVYTVYLDEEQIGYVGSKNKFENILEENLYNNEEENIAFSDINADIKYECKFIAKDTITNEEKVFAAIKEKTDITYFQYAINVDGEEKAYVKTEEEAKKIQENLLEEFEGKNIAINTVYTKNLNITSSQQIASIAENVILQVKEDEKKEQATINGVYLAVNPVKGRISSRYGARESIRNHTHKGLDIAAKIGTPIKAVADGKVTYSGVMGGYGNLIIIDHGNGITTRYGHCSKLYVKLGKQVKAGELIAAVGNTGNSTGPHLHFEIRQNGVYVNPTDYLYK